MEVGQHLRLVAAHAAQAPALRVANLTGGFVFNMAVGRAAMPANRGCIRGCRFAAFLLDQINAYHRTGYNVVDL